MPNNRVSRLRAAMEEELKRLTPDPKKAAEDSAAVSLERYNQGYPIARQDSLRLQQQNVPGFEMSGNPKTDYGRALARIRAGAGDKADSIQVKLQPGAAVGRTPSYSIREVIDETTGKPVLRKFSNLTGDAEPVKGGVAPKPKEKAYSEAVRERALKKLDSGEMLSPGERIAANIKGPEDYLKAEEDIRNALQQIEIERVDYEEYPAVLKRLGEHESTLIEMLNEVRGNRRGMTPRPDALKVEAAKNVAKTVQNDALKGIGANGAIIKNVALELEKENPAAKNKGKAFYDEETQTYFHSDGEKWIARKSKGEYAATVQ